MSTKTITIECLYSYAKNINIGDVVIVEGTNMIMWKGKTLGLRGLPTRDVIVYGHIDDCLWGNYTTLYEGNLFLDDTTTTNVPKGIRVEEEIKLDFFTDLLYAYNTNVSFLTLHDRL